MDARMTRLAAIAAAVLSLGASYRTQNFVVTASSPQFAQQVATQAEAFRRDLAVEWLGDELPTWPEPCPIRVQDNPRLGAGGATSFMFDRNNRPFQWRMSLQGSKEAILDSVLPHEVTHTIFATHFGRPLPRWADEGACTTVESSRERRKQDQMLIEFLTTQRGIPFNTMFRLTEYPRDIMPLYSQGYSVAQYLIAQGGKRKFVRYVGEGMKSENWNLTTRKFYGFEDLSDLQLSWVDWIRNGRPAIQPSDNQLADGAANGSNSNNTSVSETLASITGPADSGATESGAVRQASAEVDIRSIAPTQPQSELPEKATVASNSGEGWYAKQARLATHARQPEEPNGGRSVRPREQGEPVAGALERSVTRPQGYQQPTQRVLEAVSPAPPTEFPAIRQAGPRQMQEGYSAAPPPTIRR